MINSILKLILVGALAVLLVQSDAITLEALVGVWSQPTVVAVTIVLLMVAPILAAVRLKILLHMQRIQVPIIRVIGITYIAQLCANLLLGQLGSEVVRLTYIGGDSKQQWAGAALALTADKLLGMCGLLLVVSCGLFGFSQLSHLGWIFGSEGGLLIVLAVLIAVGMLIFSAVPARLGARLSRRLGGLRAAELCDMSATALIPFRRAPLSLVAALGVSVLTHAVSIGAIVFLCARLTDELLPPMAFAIAAALGQLSSTIPVTPSGIGVGEAVFDRVCRFLAGENVVFGFASLFLSFRVLSIIAYTPGLIALMFVPRPARIGSRTVHGHRHN